MNLIEKANNYLSSQFGVSLVTVDTNNLPLSPIQLRKSVYISVGLIDGLDFYIVELNDERLFALNESILLSKLQDRLNSKPIIFIAEKLKTSSMAIMRQKRLGYIVPGAACFIPTLLLHYSMQKKNIPRTETLSIFATTIVMQYLESQLDIQCSATDIDLFGSKMSKSRAINELEERNIIEVSKHGRINIIKFLKSRLELWSMRHSLLSPICTKIITTAKDQIYLPPIQNFCGETALSVYTLVIPPKRKCIALNELPYDVVNFSSYDSEEWGLDQRPLIDIHIYPMNVKMDKIHGHFYISPIALALSQLKPSDERVFSGYRELDDQITQKLQSQSWPTWE